MTSMIQSYMNTLKTKPSANELRSQEHFRTHVKAYRPIGHILDTNPFSPREAVHSDIRSLRYFADGIKGKGNDYSVGKINDVAIKLGSLGIAGIIATGKGSPFRKGMEFVGLACWLGAMSLWSKIAINQPLKHLKGVDLDTEYLTAAKKHRKIFYQDPQFICWDMLTDEQIKKMGDKLGVPTNIKNRRKAVENKARQVAIQGNTLAMLTAGVATPVTASLVADKLGKHVLTPLVEKIETVNAEALQTKMQLNVHNLLSDKKQEQALINLVKKDILTSDKANIIKLLTQNVSDITIQKPIQDAIGRILSGQNVESSIVTVDNQTTKNIATLLAGKQKVVNTDLVNVIKEESAKFNNKLLLSDIPEYIDNLKQSLIQKRLIDRKGFENCSKSLSSILELASDVQIKSPELTKKQLINLSRLLTTYNEKYYKDYNQKFFKYIWNDETSVNARVWEKMKSGTLKILGFDNMTLKQIANAPSDTATQQILNNYFDGLIANPEKYNKTIKDLSELSTKLLEKNEKYLKFSLEYLDNMQSLLTAYDKHGEFACLISEINSQIAKSKKDVISKYISANNNIFAPLKTLITLKGATDLSKEEYKVLQNLLFNNQTVDAFINRLDHHQNAIHNADDYWKVVGKIFAPIPENIKAKLPKHLAEKIDATSTLMQHLLTAQCDNVNIKYSTTDTGAFFRSLKTFNFDKYFDEFYTVSFDSKTSQNIFDTILYKIRTNPAKIDELKSFLYLSESDISNIKSGNFTSLFEAMCGKQNVDKGFRSASSKGAGKGFMNGGRYRFSTLMRFLEETDIGKFGSFFVGKAKANVVTKMQGMTLKDFIKTSAVDAVAYNGWVKKVGLAFIGLCAVTGIAILNIGKKNEFNPDIYEKRSAS